MKQCCSVFLPFSGPGDVHSSVTHRCHPWDEILAVPKHFNTIQEADIIARAIFKDVHVPSMTQNIRQRAFEVFFEMMSSPVADVSSSLSTSLGNNLSISPHANGAGPEEHPPAPPPACLVDMQAEFLR